MNIPIIRILSIVVLSMVTSMALAIDDATVSAIDTKASAANTKADGNNSRIQALEAEDINLHQRIDDGSLPDGVDPGDMMYWNGTAWVLTPAPPVIPTSSPPSLNLIDGVPTWGTAAVSFAVYKSFNEPVVSDWVKVDFDVEDHDDGSGFDLASDQFTAPASGVYHFSASVSYANIATGLRSIVVLRKNGAMYQVLSAGYLPTASIGQALGQTFGGSATLKLATGDVIEVWSFSDSTALTHAGGNNRWTFFTGHRVY